MNNYILANIDTDAISFCKSDMNVISKEERTKIIDSLNREFDAEISFKDDGYFPVFIVLKAKNYILYDGEKIKLKGSSLKSSTLEPKMKEMLWDFINALVFDRQHELLNIYDKYVKEVDNITDIKAWGKKMTLSATTYASKRANETKVIDAIKGTEYVEGDKIYCYYKSDDTLKLVEQFDGDYNKDRFYEKIYKTVCRFETILDISIFLNYKLKRNKKLLDNLLGISYNIEETTAVESAKEISVE